MNCLVNDNERSAENTNNWGQKLQKQELLKIGTAGDSGRCAKIRKTGSENITRLKI